jgi:TPR repeat protein
MLAQLHLAQEYEFGYLGFRGFVDRPDRKTALFWYQKAAQQDGPLKKEALNSVARVAREIKSAGN